MYLPAKELFLGNKVQAYTVRGVSKVAHPEMRSGPEQRINQDTSPWSGFSATLSVTGNREPELAAPLG